MSFTETLPGALGTLQVAPGTAPGPGGSGGAASPSPGAGWEVRVLSYKDYSTVLALLPPKMIQSFQFVKQLNEKQPGTGVFVQNLANVKKARPTVAQYPKISEALGQAIVSVLLGQVQPADALNAAAKTTDAALAEK